MTQGSRCRLWNKNAHYLELGLPSSYLYVLIMKGNTMSSVLSELRFRILSEINMDVADPSLTRAR